MCDCSRDLTPTNDFDNSLMKYKSFKQRILSAAKPSKQVEELSETLQLIDTHRQRFSVKFMTDNNSFITKKPFGQNRHRFNQSLRCSKNKHIINNRRSTSRLKTNTKFPFSGCT